MPYCTEAAFKARFGERELAQLLGTGDFAGGKAETGRTYAAAAADADAIIDSYLAMRGVQVPLPTDPEGPVIEIMGGPSSGGTAPASVLPARIVELAADLTRYELYDDVKDAGSQAGEVSAIVVRRKMALAFLERVASGDATIPGLFPAPSAAGAAGIVVSAPERVFTAETLAGF